MRAPAVPVLAIPLLTGCSSAAATDSSAVTPQPTAPSTDVTKAAFKGEWPLSADHAIIGCDTEGIQDLPTLTLNVDGVVYGLNGTALDRHRDYKQLKSGDGLWLPGTGIGDLHDAAHALCPSSAVQTP